MSTRLVERSAKALERRLSRRGFFRRAAIVGSALAASPAGYVLKKGSAYAAITTTCANCSSGSKCCDGWTEFCCTVHGVNTCPPGTMIAGWWRANFPGGGPNHCQGAPRYYMDCNSAVCNCACGSSGTCSHTCTHCTCQCANGNCGNRRTCCNRFRYGQCNRDEPCLGPIECRVVTCVPPWEWDSSCTKTDARSQSTWYHDAACLGPSTTYPARPAIVSGVVSALGAFGPVDWVWGQDRYETAAKISADAFPSGASTAYVAYGGNFPDALGAAAAAARAEGPVVLVLTGSVPAVAAAELQRLAPARIVATGGPAVISNDVVSALGAFAPVDWIWGQDRYETAAKISADAFPSGASTVYVASGDAFADALPSAAAAAQAGAPVLLVRKDGVPATTAAELTRLGPSRIVVTGGPAVISNGVVAALGAFGPVDWLWGSTRYATAAKISADAFPSGAGTVYVAYGGNFPDALGAAAAAARAGGPVLLVRNDSVPAETAAELQRLSPSRIVVAGGPGVFSGTSWGLRNSLSNGSADSTYDMGVVGHFPLMGDWTGAGVATACSVSATPSGALRWHIRNIEGPGDPDNVFEYGRAGDTPIAGDWNGNGVTTPGLVRGNQWLLRNRNSAGSADVSFAYGQPGDVPVVGRWTGASNDLPGVVQGSTWLLKTSLAGGNADIVFDFGPDTAQPVAGDWNDGGRDLPGRFEDGQWQMRHSLSGGAPDSTFSFGAAHDIPLVWGRVT